ncbi:MAG: right-handed parallel beta-helix repeat-containing protein [Lacipirellulaceae bacterium]
MAARRSGGGPRSSYGRLLAFESLEDRRALTVVPYPLVNGGFESPELDATNSFQNGVSGWSSSGTIGTTFEVPSASPSPAAEGDQYVFADSNNWQMWQTGPVVAAGTRYILKVDLFPLTTGTPQASVQLRDSVTGAILSGAANFSSPNPRMRQVAIPAGEWTTVTVAFHSADLTEAVGKALEIRVLGSRFAVDNVRLTSIDSAEAIYLSSSAGASGNDGFSAGAALSSFADLAPYLPLRPGEQLLLKAGDTFSGELNVRGKGTAAEPITVGRYGVGANPVINPNDLEFGKGLVWNNASHARINGIDVENSKLGIYLRYEWTDVGSRDVVIENCNFRNLSDATLDPPKHNFELAWSDAIWVGGQAWNQAEFANRLDGLTIRNVTADTVAHLFGTNFYYPGVYKSRITNLLIEDCQAVNSLGTFALFGVDGGVVRRFTSIGGVQRDTWAGSTLGFIQNSKNVVIEDSLFASISRAQSADGSGMDFEGNTENVTFRNNVIHSNAGSAILILTTQGPNTNLVITGNTIYNNAVDPWNSEINSEIQGSTGTGVISNNGIYRRSTAVNFLAPGSNWSGFTITGNRQLEYASVAGRPTWWDFATDGSFAGWGGLNHWGSATVSGGLLTGQSLGVDPYIESPPTWADSNTSRYVWVRMSQTAGAFGQVFYQTETDPTWDQAKSVAFPIIADGQMRDYFIDLGQLVTLNGVITRVRLDPTVEAGSTMAIDFVRITDSTDPWQAAPATLVPTPVAVTLTSIAAEDGFVTESAKDSGVGGTVSSTATTMRLGDDASNRATRMFLSFDTSSIPDNATIVEATLGITRSGNPTGTIPIGVADSPWGDLPVDIATQGGFGGVSGLAASDFNAPATKLAVSKFAWPAYGNGMTIYSRLEDADEGLISRTGRTQFRISYQNDDDNDGVADFMPYHTGNATSAAQRPTLTIRYVVRPPLPGDFDGNAIVEDADRGVWRANYGRTGANVPGDGNGDGVVNAADYTVWRDNLGAVAAAAASGFASAEGAAAASDQPTPATDGAGDPQPFAAVSLWTAPFTSRTFATSARGDLSQSVESAAAHDDALLLVVAEGASQDTPHQGLEGVALGSGDDQRDADGSPTIDGPFAPIGYADAAFLDL